MDDEEYILFRFRQGSSFGAIAAASAVLGLQTEDLADLTTEDGEELETDF